jgi:hypothetical protein
LSIMATPTFDQYLFPVGGKTSLSSRKAASRAQETPMARWRNASATTEAAGSLLHALRSGQLHLPRHRYEPSGQHGADKCAISNLMRRAG